MKQTINVTSLNYSTEDLLEALKYLAANVDNSTQDMDNGVLFKYAYITALKDVYHRVTGDTIKDELS